MAPRTERNLANHRTEQVAHEAKERNLVHRDGDEPSRPRAEEFGWPSLCLMTLSFMLATFLVALDYNIITTAIPRITTEFRRLDHVSWYGAAYSLCRMALQPSYGRLGSFFPLKNVFCCANVILVAGSVVCATARSSDIFILGRAIQGCGASGMFSTVLTLCGHTVSRKKLPIYISVLSSMYVFASVVGPVLGGVFAESRLTWRFCFWLNLPISAVSVGLTVVIVHEPEREASRTSHWERLASLDIPGTILLIGAITCLVLALEWGGISLPWSDRRVWGLLVAFAIALGLFLIVQVYQKEKALIPVRLILQRTVATSCVFSILLNLAVEIPTYLLPIFFQASRGMDPQASGLSLIPLAVSIPLAAVVSGTAVSFSGHYVPWMVAGGAVSTVGYGLLRTLTPSSSTGSITGYQILVGGGCGLAYQLPLTAMRNVLADDDMPMTNALFVFFVGLGTLIALGGGQSIFLESLSARLRARLGVTEAARILDLGAGAVTAENINPEDLPLVTDAYSYATTTAMNLAIAAAGAATLCGCVMEWKRLKSES
ncbi:major facilitator superfamily domain-containing protein [Xylariomycetidae sp. FL2044]|nr:major facilitator superfamily domain-containing protein [Xylariomycetidae sp. FL2044]